MADAPGGRAGAEHAADEIDPRYMVPGLSRGLALLGLFTRRRPAQTLAELAAGLGLTRSATYRIVYTLEKEGFLGRDPVTRRFRLTSRVLALGFEYLHSQDLPEQARPVLRELSDATSAAAHLVVLEGWHVLYLARVAPAAPLVSNLQVGTRLPCHVTASGRALMACLDAPALEALHRRLVAECREGPPPPPLEALGAQAEADRARGHVYRESVLDPGWMTFATVVRDGSGAAVASINVIGPAKQMEGLGGEAGLRDLVLGAAARLSRGIGWTGGAAART